MSGASKANATSSDGSKPSTAPSVLEPRLLGESEYDRFTSFLMALVLGSALVVGWLGLVFWSMQGFSAKASAPLNLIEVYGGGGGSPDGDPNETLKQDVPNAEAGPIASNNEVEAEAFEEPTPAQTNAALLDLSVVKESAAEYAQPVEIGAMEATGRRARKEGTGGVPLGDGPGDGGVSEAQRWSIIYGDGVTVEEYAQMLDRFGVELGVLQGQEKSLEYVARFSSPSPIHRTVNTGQGERRLIFTWQGGDRKKGDVDLLGKCGVKVGSGHILHFYPDDTVKQLRALEVNYKGLQATEIRRTVFKVVRSGGDFGIEVVSQTPL